MYLLNKTNGQRNSGRLLRVSKYEAFGAPSSFFQQILMTEIMILIGHKRCITENDADSNALQEEACRFYQLVWGHMRRDTGQLAIQRR